MFVSGFLLGILFDPNDKDDTFLQNICGLVPNYTVLQPTQLCPYCPCAELIKHHSMKKQLIIPIN
jgi:hypothetical protein